MFQATQYIVFLSDDQCIQMVTKGIPSKLMALLQPINSDITTADCDVVNETSPTLQHAIFSCLRNMAIPGWLLVRFMFTEIVIMAVFSMYHLV